MCAVVGRLVSQLRAKAQETEQSALLRKLKDVFRRYQIATGRAGGAIDQPGAARLGRLLRGRALQRVLQLHELGRKKVRRHIGRLRNERASAGGGGASSGLYETLRLLDGYRVRRPWLKVALSRIGPISLEEKQTGERSARKSARLRSTWRGLETWHGRDGVTLANERASQTPANTTELRPKPARLSSTLLSTPLILFAGADFGRVCCHRSLAIVSAIILRSAHQASSLPV